jgi:hypothetical protein
MGMRLPQEVLFHNVEHGCRKQFSDGREQDSQREEPGNVLTNISLNSSKNFIDVSRIEEYDFIHFWSVTLVNTIKTTSFTPPSVIK